MEGPRACRKDEFEEVIGLINRVFRKGTDQDISTDYPLVFNKSQLENMRIVKDNGKVASLVPIAPRDVVASGDDRFMIAIIAPTVTHTDYRKRGYGTLCLADCIRIMEEKGYDLSVLWTAESTFPFYQKLGWEAVSSQGWLYRLRESDVDFFQNHSFKVRHYNSANENYLNSIMRIHEAEPYRIVRSSSDYRALFALPETTTYLAMRGREVAAYLTFGEGVNKPGIIESGGEPMALEALVKRILLKQAPAKEIHALVPLSPSALRQLLEEKGAGDKRPIEEEETVGYQMVRVNKLRGFLHNIQNYLAKKAAGLEGDLSLVCRESAEVVTLKFSGGSVEFPTKESQNQVILSRRELARLMFGPHRAAEPINVKRPADEILEAIFPYYFPIWEMDHC